MADQFSELAFAILQIFRGSEAVVADDVLAYDRGHAADDCLRIDVIDADLGLEPAERAHDLRVELDHFRLAPGSHRHATQVESLGERFAYRVFDVVDRSHRDYAHAPRWPT